MSDPRHNEKDLTDEEVTAMYSPSIEPLKAWWPVVPHYYGDAVRQLLLGAAALMLVASPFYSANLGIEFPFIVVGALISAALAAAMNPRSQWVSIASALLSGVGVAIYAMWGVFGYDATNPVALVLRFAVAVIFLFVFYFSMKTMRAFSLGQIGKREMVGEFESAEERAEEEALERERVERSESN